MSAISTGQTVKWSLSCVPTLNTYLGQADLKSKHRESAGHIRAHHYLRRFDELGPP